MRKKLSIIFASISIFISVCPLAVMAQPVTAQEEVPSTETERGVSDVEPAELCSMSAAPVHVVPPVR